MNKIFASILNFFNDITGHYLIALLLVALLVKLVLLPFGIKQQKTAQKQTKLRPKEMAIRKKYSGRTDQPTMTKMNTEIQEMYREGGYNPLGGCLPMIIQFAIVMIIYSVMMNPLQYVCGYSSEAISALREFLGVAATKRGDIELLSLITADKIPAIQALGKGLENMTMESLPNFSLFGMANALAAKPTFKSWLVTIPIITFVGQFFASKLQRKFMPQPMQDGAQTKSMNVMMDLFLPAMTTVIAFTVPAAVGIYWFFNNMLSVLQTVILAKAMPLPKITEEDIKAAENEYSAKNAKKKLAEAKKKQRLSDDYDSDEEDKSFDDGGPTRYDRD